MVYDTLRLEDLDDALALSAAEGWNQTATDWRRLVELEPRGCFAAREGGRLVGTVTTTTYGDALAWIGMMVVHPEFRGRAIGRELMRAALDHLSGRGVADVLLDATPAGRPLYESLGFVAAAEMERWQGVARAGEPVAPVLFGHEDWRALVALDRAAYGVDRARVLERLVAEGEGEPLILEAAVPGSEAIVGGYALARPGRNATYIGPIIASSAEAVESLLDGMLAQLGESEVCLDLHRGGWLEPAQLSARGLTMRRELLRMSLGPHSGVATARSICASAGPELG